MLYFSQAAKADIEEIGDYIACHSPARVDFMLHKIYEKCKKIEAMPKAWASRPELGENIRIATEEPYLVFYREIDDGVRILRVLHGHRNIPVLFS